MKISSSYSKFWTAALVFFMLMTVAVQGQYSAYEWEDRDEWMDVARILELAGVEKGQTVADIGCHEGYMSMYLAKAVGPAGQVLAEDVSKYRLGRLEEHAEERSLKNIQTILGAETDPKLPANRLDIVFVIDAYHEMKEPATMLRHFRNSLKAGGKILILEKLKSEVRNKSRKAQTNSHSLAPDIVRKELVAAGFKILEEVRDLGDWENNPKKQIWCLVAVYEGSDP